jgi:anti-anti-sigma regulatory factor
VNSARPPATAVVFGFGGREFPLDARVGALHEQILERLRGAESRDVVFDVTGTRTLPSHMYGLMASLTTRGYVVWLRNPSDHVREVLRTSRLDTLLKLSSDAAGRQPERADGVRDE